MMRTLQIYSLNFLIYHTAVLAVVMLYITFLAPIYHITESLHLLTPFLPLLLPHPPPLVPLVIV